MAATIWTLLCTLVIAPLGALAVDRPSSATGSGTSTLRRRWTVGEHSGVTECSQLWLNQSRCGSCVHASRLSAQKHDLTCDYTCAR
jgi:hypothetical protein